MNIYDSVFKQPEYNQAIPDRIDTTINWCKEKKLKTVLDAGCGRGHYLQRLLDEGFKAEGIEPSEYLVENDLKELPVKNVGITEAKGKYDGVICMDVLEHISHPEIDEVLESLKKLAPVGLFGIANHKDQWLGQELHLIQENAGWWWEKLQEHFEGVNLLHGEQQYFLFEVSRV